MAVFFKFDYCTYNILEIHIYIHVVLRPSVEHEHFPLLLPKHLLPIFSETTKISKTNPHLESQGVEYCIKKRQGILK